MKWNRRSFLGGSMAAAAACPASIAAAQAVFTGPKDVRVSLEDRILSFEDAGGSIHNSGAENNRVYTKAIKYLSSRGGGILVIPAKAYPFSGSANESGINVTVSGYGATFIGANCRLTIPSDSTAYDIQGLTLVETSGSRSTYLLNCGGSNCHFKDVHFEKSPPAGGYVAYCREQTSGNLFENVSFSGSNGIFLGGHDHEIRGGWAQSEFGDDCWAIKAATRPCYNIRISGFEARGFTAIASIGSEIGTVGADNPDRDMFVRNVVMENCSAVDCTYLAYIKPGGNSGADYRDGVVEDVSIVNCRHEDPSGNRFRNGVYVSPGRGAIVRRLTLKDLTINARGKDPAVQAVTGQYLRVLNSTDGAGTAASIEDVVATGVRCTDPYGGAATGPSTPGVPLHSLVAIEKQDQRLGNIGNVDISDSSIDGCARMAVMVGPQVSGPVRLDRCTLNNFAAAIYAAVDKGSVLARSPITLENITANPSPNAPATTRGVMADYHPDKTVDYVGNKDRASIGTIPAGTDVSTPILSAARNTWVSKVQVVVGQSIPQSDLDHIRFTVRNAVTGKVLGSATTATNGLALTAGVPVSISGDVQFSGEAPILPKGGQLLLEVSHAGRGVTLVEPTFIVHHVPFGVQ